MKQLDDLAATGEIHHYKIDTGLFLLLFHARLSDEHAAAAQALRAKIGKKPSKAKSAALAQQALDLLNAARTTLEGPNYSAIYGHLSEGLRDASI